jgi:hypothetical protein
MHMITLVYHLIVTFTIYSVFDLYVLQFQIWDYMNPKYVTYLEKSEELFTNSPIHSILDRHSNFRDINS